MVHYSMRGQVYLRNRSVKVSAVTKTASTFGVMGDGLQTTFCTMSLLNRNRVLSEDKAMLRVCRSSHGQTKLIQSKQGDPTIKGMYVGLSFNIKKVCAGRTRSP